MTNQKMLETILAVLDNTERRQDGEAFCILLKAKEQLTEDVRRDAVKARGGAKADKLIREVLAELVKKPDLVGYHPIGDKFAFVGSFRAYVLNDNYGFEKAKKPTEIVKNAVPANIRSGYKLEIDIDQLKGFIAEDKANYKIKKKHEPIAYDTPNFRIGFNAQYLLEFCQMFHTNELWAVKPLSACVGWNAETGEWGILLPVRLKDEVK